MKKPSYEEVVERLREIVTCFGFYYNELCCGVDPFSENHYDVWYGEKFAEMHSLDEVLNTKFFDGKTLQEIFPYIEIDGY